MIVVSYMYSPDNEWHTIRYCTIRGMNNIKIQIPHNSAVTRIMLTLEVPERKYNFESYEEKKLIEYKEGMITNDYVIDGNYVWFEKMEIYKNGVMCPYFVTDPVIENERFQNTFSSKSLLDGGYFLAPTQFCKASLTRCILCNKKIVECIKCDDYMENYELKFSIPRKLANI
jgi:hypothetical protein